MVVVMTPEATDADIEAVAERVRANGGEAFVSRGTLEPWCGGLIVLAQSMGLVSPSGQAAAQPETR